jgi:uncharacterized iron-regulated membrane protein
MMSHSTSQTVVNGQAFSYVPNEIHNLLMFGDTAKNIVNVLGMTLIVMGLMSVQWVLWGYSLAFGGLGDICS